MSVKKQWLVRSRGLDPPRAAPLAPQASASTNSATTAGMNADREASRRSYGGGCNKSPLAEQGQRRGPPRLPADAAALDFARQRGFRSRAALCCIGKRDPVRIETNPLSAKLGR